MPINYNKLQNLMETKEVSEYKLRKYSGVGGATLDKMLGRSEGNIDTRSLEKLCKFLKCQPGDIMEYTED